MDGKIIAITFKRRARLEQRMVHVLETGLEYMQKDNPTGKPAVKGYNIINGQLSLASDGAVFQSTNPAHLADCLGEFPLSTREDVRAALNAAREAFPDWAATPAPREGKSSATWAACSWNTKRPWSPLRRERSAKR